jgi:hypothetical protein
VAALLPEFSMMVARPLRFLALPTNFQESAVPFFPGMKTSDLLIKIADRGWSVVPEPL